ncbi:MAG: TRAP transporter small permease [Steroidobacteraceae bacterium]
MNPRAPGRVPNALRWIAFVERAARAAALLGGALILLMALLVLASVIGRELFARPVPGDFEIVGFGMAVSAFLCLPWCQLTRGHLVVDFFLAHAPAGIRAALDATSAVILGMLALLLGWRMAAGMLDAFRYRDISVILGLPYWWAYPFAVVSLLLLAATCLVTARRAREGAPS